MQSGFAACKTDLQDMDELRSLTPDLACKALARPLHHSEGKLESCIAYPALEFWAGVAGNCSPAFFYCGLQELVEQRGIEPLASALRTPRSPN